MKKALLVILSMTLIACNCMVSLGSETITSSNGTSWTGGTDNTSGSSVPTSDGTSKRKVTVEIDTETNVYSVDVAWGSMNFKYGKGIWQPGNHSYTDNAWKIDNAGDNDIVVTNHSNVDVKVAMSATLDTVQGYTIYGEFTDKTDATSITTTSTNQSPTVAATTLLKGELNKPGEAKKLEKELLVTGVIGNKLENTQQIGTVTVTITP